MRVPRVGSLLAGLLIGVGALMPVGAVAGPDFRVSTPSTANPGIRAGSAPLAPATAPPSGLHVSGNQVVDAGGDTVSLVGVNRSGTEYRCIQGYGIFEGPSDAASVQAMVDWHAKAVRIPLNEDCWLAINGAPSTYSGATYKNAIADYVGVLEAHGLIPILELHWSAAGTNPATGQEPMPNRDHTVTFWSEVADAYKSDTGVVFDLFNEPFPDGNQDTTAAWQCWRDGGTCPGVPFEAAGMQELVDAVRATGATNVIMLGGVRYANALSQWLTYKPIDPTGNLAASWHAYNFNACASVECWDAEVQPVLSATPLVAGEIGEDDCGTAFIERVMRWLDGHQTSYLPWAWETNFGCFSLITDFDGTPTGTYGAGFRDHLADRAQLDPSFGVDGTAATLIGANVAAYTVAIQPDGALVVGGQKYNGVDFDAALARYHPDGRLDTSFADGGTTVHSFAAHRDTFFDVAIQGDGKIVAGGLAETGTVNSDDFLLVRYNIDGTLDTSFGTGGAVYTDFRRDPSNYASDLIYSVVIQPDGKILAGGYSNSRNDDYALARYMPDGSLDLSFGAGGKVVNDFGPYDRIYGLALQPDGRIVGIGEDSVIAVVRYMPDGALDSSFGSGGRTTVNILSNFGLGDALTLQPDGRIVVGGYVNQPLADFALGRLLADGTVDSSFGTNGRVITRFGPDNDIVSGVGIQADGQIVAAGSADSGSTAQPDQDFALARYNPNGSLDPSFGSGGTLVTDWGLTNENAQDMAFQQDGRIVAVGNHEDALNGQSVALARYFGGPPFPTATIPGAPTSVTAAAGDGQASVSWSPPATDGGSAITSYAVAAAPGGHNATVAGNLTTATVTGLSNGTSYRFTVTATNAIGMGPDSAPSAAATPQLGAQATTSTVPPEGGTATTDPTNSGPTPSDPTTTSVTVPSGTGGGSVTIAETAVGETAPGGYQFVGQQIDITSTAGTSASNPLTIVFTIDSSAIRTAFGLGPADPLPAADQVAITRAEGTDPPAVVPMCTTSTPPIDPTRCVSDRGYVNGGDDLRITILTGSASHWNTAIKPVVTVTNTGYSPKATTVAQGGLVLWTFAGSKSHSATDNLKLGPAKAPLFNSGAITTGRYGSVFRAAGTYTYGSTVKGDPGSFAGSVAVPLRINPLTGGTTTSFTVTWSSSTISGYVFDVQYRFMKAGSKSWGPFKTWQSGASAASAVFTPPSGAGTYAFSARLRNTSTGMASLWSPETAIVVH
jgi:endoglucanase